MTMTKEEKTELMGEFHRHDGDTGSPEVQVAILTRRIEQLTDHLRTHSHDNSSRPRAAQAGRPAAPPSGVSQAQGRRLAT